MFTALLKICIFAITTNKPCSLSAGAQAYHRNMRFAFDFCLDTSEQHWIHTLAGTTWHILLF